MLTTEQRFWDLVNKDCWLWRGALNEKGYGYFGTHLGKNFRAHRMAWEYTYGPIPKGMHVLHTCDVRHCVNPAHLRLGTHAENMADMKAKDRHARGERSIHAVLTEAQVKEIIRDFKWYGPRRTNRDELAARYGVKPATIYHAATGRSWAYLQPEKSND